MTKRVCGCGFSCLGRVTDLLSREQPARDGNSPAGDHRSPLQKHPFARNISDSAPLLDSGLPSRDCRSSGLSMPRQLCWGSHCHLAHPCSAPVYSTLDWCTEDSVLMCIYTLAPYRPIPYYARSGSRSQTPHQQSGTHKAAAPPRPFTRGTLLSAPGTSTTLHSGRCL